jgi:L-fuconolactonase
VLVQPATAYGFNNSYHADSQKTYANRTVSVGLLDPFAADAAEKLSYWITERGMHGMRISPGARDITDGSADNFWKRAGELGVPITISGGGQPDRIDNIRNMAERFPDVRIAPDHMAGWSNSAAKAEMTAALEALAKCPNAYLRISNTSFVPYDGHTPEEQSMFRKVIDAFTPQRMMWGTNYPANRVGGYAAQVEIGRTAVPFLSADDRAWILGGTAMEVWPQLKANA